MDKRGLVLHNTICLMCLNHIETTQHLLLTVG